jgi:hypothetical protein
MTRVTSFNRRAGQRASDTQTSHAWEGSTPENPGGATPITRKGMRLMSIVRPTAAGSDPKRRFQ